jgi:hypothetical protein
MLKKKTDAALICAMIRVLQPRSSLAIVVR